MQPIHLKDLLVAGCHFGHKADRWHPKASAFIYGERNGIHIIDLAKTKSGLEKAAAFIKETVKNGDEVLFVGTKRQAASILHEEAKAAKAPFITKRWIGGFLTNWEQIHRNLEKIRRLTDEEKDGTWKKYPKHERIKLSRYLKRLLIFYGGVVDLREPPKALVVIDIRREDVAIKEAVRMDVARVGIVDTNSDPNDVDYVIPSNDDAVGAIELLVKYLVSAYKEGKAEYEKEKLDKPQITQGVKVQSEVSKVESPQKPDEKGENKADKVEEKPVNESSQTVDKSKKEKVKAPKEKKQAKIVEPVKAEVVKETEQKSVAKKPKKKSTIKKVQN